eukprot:Gb_12269 [translate_table: standard]
MLGSGRSNCTKWSSGGTGVHGVEEKLDQQPFGRRVIEWRRENAAVEPKSKLRAKSWRKHHSRPVNENTVASGHSRLPVGVRRSTLFGKRTHLGRSVCLTLGCSLSLREEAAAQGGYRRFARRTLTFGWEPGRDRKVRHIQQCSPKAIQQVLLET